eukprot:COSAG03_NODE_643_length_6532_cov_3.761387_4_plen_225_part_00
MHENAEDLYRRCAFHGRGTWAHASRSAARTPRTSCPRAAEAPDNQPLRALPTGSSLLTAGVWAGWLLRAKAAAVRLSATRVHCSRLAERAWQNCGAHRMMGRLISVETVGGHHHTDPTIAHAQHSTGFQYENDQSVGRLRRIERHLAAVPAAGAGRMPHRILGRTGLSVSLLSLGTGGARQFGSTVGMAAAAQRALVHRALELGVNLFDTRRVACSIESSARKF